MSRKTLLLIAAATFACESSRGGGGDPITDSGVPSIDGGSAPLDGSVPDSGTPPSNAGPVDLLFVVDNSFGMDRRQEQLASAFSVLLDALAPDADVQIGVVSTDVTAGTTEVVGLATATFNAEAPFNLTSYDTAACTSIEVPHSCLRSPDPNRRILRTNSSMTRAELNTAFGENVRLGNCGSGSEQGLAAARRAIEQATAGSCNEGFIREEARLVVVYVSDEEDSDRTPIEEYVLRFFTVKDPSKVRVAVITGAVGQDATRCRSPSQRSCGESVCRNPPPQGSGATCGRDEDCPSGEVCRILSPRSCDTPERQYFEYCHWCSYYAAEDCCAALAGARYVDLAKQLEPRVRAAVPEITGTECDPDRGTPGACLIESICEDDLRPALTRIADTLIIR